MVIFRTVHEIASGVRDVLHVLARVISDVHKVHQEQMSIRATMDQLLLQLQKQSSEHAIGLNALLGAEVESEDERAEREKLEKDFEEFQAVMKRLEEV